MLGVTESWRAEFVPAANVTLAAPSGASTTSWSGSTGAAAASRVSAPKLAAARTSVREVTVPRAPAASAPITDPTAMVVVRSA
jgi:hypothetical protein